jgi:hypothetical protein
MKLKYDHAFTADPGHRFHKKMIRFGFIPLPGQVEHPGKHFCRFVAFRESTSELPVYLEFIDGRDPKNPVRNAGLSLRALGSLEKAYKAFPKKKIQATFVHKNYEWKKDSKSRLPGWNFVTFKNTGFRSLFPWVTEYEPRKGRKPMKVQRHPNGVRRIHAVEIEVNRPGEIFFKKIFGKDLERPLTLPGGQRLHFAKGRSTRLKSIVLETISLKRTGRFIHGPVIHWQNKPALKVENPAKMWDLFIVER